MTAIRAGRVLRARRGSVVLSRAIGALLWITVAADALFLVGLLASGGENSPFVNVGLSLATQWIPVTVFWLVAGRTGFKHVPVLLAAAGVTLSAIGDGYYSLAMDSDGYLAFPLPADAGYLLFYPLMVLAVAMLARRQLVGVGRLVLLETAVATAGASAVLAVVLDPVISGALEGDSAIDSAIALAYPLFDLILLAVIAGMASVPTIRIGRRWWALIAGLVIFAVADVVYALMEGQGTYVAGTPLDATWAVGLGFITWWVAGVSHSRATSIAPPRRAYAVPVPAVAVLAGLAVLVVGTQLRLSVFAVVLAALTVGLGAVPIIFRQAMLGRMLASEKEAVRRLTELDQAKTDIMVTMNHEFRTPLTSINGHVELLLDGGGGEMSPPAMDMLRTIERNGARLKSLIDETLTVSRLADGQDVFVRSPLELADLVTGAVARVEPRATSRQIELVCEREDSVLIVDADAAHLERAVVNLVDNAVKFTDPGGHVTVSVHASRADDDAIIRITDDGMGIPADDLRWLFTRFFRASNVQNAAIAGVGLGLSIAGQVVRAHGGTIAVDSVVGQGTTVTVALPVAVPGTGARR